jgi:sugar-specific transcriptional regulator TrmB
MQQLSTLLSGIGISQDAITLYVTLFEKGEMSIIAIADALKLHRPRVYVLLQELLTRGLVVTHLKGKRKVYVAASPEVLRDLCVSIADSAEKLLPELSRIYGGSGTKPTISVYEGRAGVTNVFRDLVMQSKKGETFYRFSSEKNLDHTNTYLPKDYRKIRDAKKLERFVITAPRIGKGKRTRMERAMKFIPPGYDLFEQDVIELIYADRVAFIDLNTETSFVIESPKLADFHKKLFRLLYQKL